MINVKLMAGHSQGFVCLPAVRSGRTMWSPEAAEVFRPVGAVWPDLRVEWFRLPSNPSPHALRHRGLALRERCESSHPGGPCCCRHHQPGQRRWAADRSGPRQGHLPPGITLHHRRFGHALLCQIGTSRGRPLSAGHDGGPAHTGDGCERNRLAGQHGPRRSFAPHNRRPAAVWYAVPQRPLRQQPRRRKGPCTGACASEGCRGRLGSWASQTTARRRGFSSLDGRGEAAAPEFRTRAGLRGLLHRYRSTSSPSWPTT